MVVAPLLLQGHPAPFAPYRQSVCVGVLLPQVVGPMTDDYARLRAALAAGPTPGPWSDESSTSSHDRGHQCSVEANHHAHGPFASTGWVIADIPDPWERGVNGPPTDEGRAGINAAYIAACDPDAEHVTTLARSLHAMLCATHIDSTGCRFNHRMEATRMLALDSRP